MDQGRPPTGQRLRCVKRFHSIKLHEIDSPVAGALIDMAAVYMHVVLHKVSFSSGVGPTSEKAKQEEEGEEKRQPAVGLQWKDFSLLSVLPC